MKCQGCGHDFPSTLTRCTRCGQLSPKRTQKSSQSRLIEFPRKARASSELPQAESAVPAWKAELNERVRQIKAKRNAEMGSSNDAPPDIERAGADSINSLVTTEPAAPALSGARATNHIVEAALTRARRASEIASRAALPKIEPAKPAAKSPIVLDNEATARALEMEADISPTSHFVTSPLPKLAGDAASPYDHFVDAPTKATRAGEPEHGGAEKMASEDEFRTLPGTRPAAARLVVIDEMESIDYLEAEIKKVDKALSAEFSRNESPSLFAHAVIGLIDLLAIAVSSAPFLLLVELLNGNFMNRRTQIAAGAIVLTVSFFYLALTQCLCGKTFGMMLTNTRLVDARTYEPPSYSRVLARTFGYLIAVAPALLGILWVVGNRRRRGWHDFLSGTMVARDF